LARWQDVDFSILMSFLTTWVSAKRDPTRS
jgi:hypothetical protein